MIRDLYETSKVDFKFDDISTKTENALNDYVLENYPLKKELSLNPLNLLNLENTTNDKDLNKESMFYKIKYQIKLGEKELIESKY